MKKINQNKKLFVVPIALLLGVSAVKAGAYVKESNQYINTLEKTWEISLPAAISEETVKNDLKVFDYTFSNSNAEKLSSSFEWTSNYTSIISIIGQAQNLDSNVNVDDLVDLIDYSSSKKVHAEFKDKTFMILVFDTKTNVLRIIENN